MASVESLQDDINFILWKPLFKIFHVRSNPLSRKLWSESNWEAQFISFIVNMCFQSTFIGNLDINLDTCFFFLNKLFLALSTLGSVRCVFFVFNDVNISCHVRFVFLVFRFVSIGWAEPFSSYFYSLFLCWIVSPLSKVRGGLAPLNIC